MAEGQFGDEFMGPIPPLPRRPSRTLVSGHLIFVTRPE